MGHIKFDNLVRINTKQYVRDMPNIKKTFKHYLQAMLPWQTRESFNSKEHQHQIHWKVCGPTRTQSLQGENYFMMIIDDFSIVTWVLFLKDKYEAFEKFKSFKSLVENETNLKIKCLRLEKGGEFFSN